MSWLTFAIITAGLYGVFDFLIKLTSGKIDDGLATLIVDFTAAVVAGIYVLITKMSGAKLHITKEGLTYALIAGFITGLYSITFIKVFSAGANITVGVSIVRIGMIIVSICLGVIFLKMKLDPLQILGIILAISGLGLILLK